MSGRGRLIAFEGVEGAGKSTHIRTAAAVLRARGVTVVETREPGGTPLGQNVRQLVLHAPDAPAPLAELLLYAADRAQHIAEVIAPALRSGAVVLTDRFSASTIAYQGYARGLDLAVVVELDRLARQDVEPDLVIVLDCPVDVGLQRAQGSDRFHREDLAFHQRVRDGFLTLARNDARRYRVVSAAAPAAEVERQVLAAVEACLRD